VLVTGEPGAGKTRLVEEFSSWCAARGAATSQARSYPAEGALAYGPVVAWLRSDALAGHLGRLGPARREELARLLPELRPAAPGRPAPAPPPDREQRRLLFEALAGAVLASPGPLLLVATTCTGPTARPSSSCTTCSEPSRGPRSWWWRPPGQGSWIPSTPCTTC
jgi:hypothetical protein